MSDAALRVESHRGPYEVHFVSDLRDGPSLNPEGLLHFLVDERVAELHEDRLADLVGERPVVRVHASEETKRLDRFSDHVERLVAGGIDRGATLVAIGGGVVQDIACFIAGTLFRGVRWAFYPTTLLAQADSCIGSKSSVNVGPYKNLLGTFTPPERVIVDAAFLGTLEEQDMRSGVGEMLKVHLIQGPEAFAEIAQDYGQLFNNPAVLHRYVRRSLEIKKRFVEEDEFDHGPRSVLNYGHSFGHAIESATSFGIPHGIAVTVGMDMANFVAWRLGRIGESEYRRIHSVLARNYDGFGSVEIPFEPFVSALARDKKNRGGALGLILKGPKGVERVYLEDRETILRACADFFCSERLV